MTLKKRIKLEQNINDQIYNNEEKIINETYCDEPFRDKYNFNRLLDKKLNCNSDLTVSSDTSMDISTTMSLSTLSLHNSKEIQNQLNCTGFNKTLSIFENNFNDTKDNLQNTISTTNSSMPINTIHYLNPSLLEEKNFLTLNSNENIEKLEKSKLLNEINFNNSSLKLNDSFSIFNNSIKNSTALVFENIYFKRDIDNIFFIEYTSNYKNLKQLELICFTITWIQSRIYEIILVVPNLRYLHQHTLENNYLQHVKYKKGKGKLTKTVIKSNDPIEVIESMEFLDISLYNDSLYQYLLINQLLDIYYKFVSLYIYYCDLKIEKINIIFEENKLLYEEFINCNEDRINTIKCLNNYL
ncbi:Hypothetical protein SRAE_2000018200 [Strongyloides ratti]|uniref:Uncharacterized protein n=1 Tax=Strongyloides ratti TaxID=34506 RepID=A0A090LBJ5_STRRB|nr:Hypothetical protein SRAE_2000018200 [Strongyloides ratti]CEF65503.1 Hypothetical protein SRAE_2000018200 [Strongyloides ratti]